jgi:hypothetical protein
MYMCYEIQRRLYMGIRKELVLHTRARKDVEGNWYLKTHKIIKGENRGQKGKGEVIRCVSREERGSREIVL